MGSIIERPGRERYYAGHDDISMTWSDHRADAVPGDIEEVLTREPRAFSSSADEVDATGENDENDVVTMVATRVVGDRLEEA